MFYSTVSLVTLISTIFIACSFSLDADRPYTLPFSPTNIAFVPCPEDHGFPPQLQCGTLSVPIDWDKPSGEQFQLGIVRLPAPSNSTKKVGDLFFNPGGPGAPASDVVGALPSLALNNPSLASIIDSFDVIGVDPRGIGLSSRIHCNTSIFAESVSLFPSTQAEYDAMISKNRRLGESCLQLTGPLLKHIDTLSVAKDHEAVRLSLGSQPFTFYGASYGTVLGAQYASLFPSTLRAMALDAVLQHTQSEISTLIAETTAYALSLTSFLAWASSPASHTPLSGTNTTHLWLSLLSAASTSPLPAPGCDTTACAPTVSYQDILRNTQPYLHFPSPSPLSPLSWPALAVALYNASKGDATALSTRLDGLDSALAAQATLCLDWTSSTSSSLSKMRDKQRLAAQLAPLTRGMSGMWGVQGMCVGWVVPVRNAPRALDVEVGRGRVVLVASTGDPRTGYGMGLGVREELRGSVVVTRRGEGHMSLWDGGEAAAVIAEYLVGGREVEDGMVVES
ncbi:hypothetical protein EJ04DRAFT_586282 [Polyplosphaeria fusca]|uniref:AB hydrolase-1 domain-containing protein n=1 Tax=Polyplosphaeria fusca TaxID=682080 RepID=A0A9P4UYZ9_9PLEO|nr:hypothetical protein EJ04DRAFT_586282 [Polyplosphaeria fusca]